MFIIICLARDFYSSLFISSSNWAIRFVQIIYFVVINYRTIRFVNVSAGQVEDLESKLPTGGRRVVRNGDFVVLSHKETGRSLRDRKSVV